MVRREEKVQRTEVGSVPGVRPKAVMLAEEEPRLTLTREGAKGKRI
jgi:hypothetical protein